MRKAKWLAVAVLLWACPQVWAQKPPSLEAHRHYFVAITNDVKDAETPALAAYLRKAGLKEQEHKVAVQALIKFKHRYETLIDAYNNSPATLSGTNEDTSMFLTQLDMLVYNTLEMLQATVPLKSFHPEKMVPDYMSETVPITEHRHGVRIIPVQGQMVPHYTTSRTNTDYVDANGNHTDYETLHVEGYTNCSGCSTVTHQGKVSNTLGGNQPTYGNKVSPPSWISVSNMATAQFAQSCFDIGTTCASDNWSEQTQILCSSLGNGFDTWGWFEFTMHPALVFSKSNSGGPGQGWYNVSEWCQPQYVPPDLTMFGIQNNQNFTPTFFETLGIVVNSTLTPGAWLSTPGLSQGLTGSWDLQYCTHTTPPY